MTHELWANLNTHILNYLQSVSLADLVRQQQQKADVVRLQDHRQPQSSTHEPGTAVAR
jgi:DNA-binding IscR family transcriptional regulator